MRSRSIDILKNEEALKSLSILIDTREQDTEKARKRYKTFSVPYNRATLDYGDYTYNAMIDGSPIHDIKERVYPLCAIERKMNLDELAGCFTHERKRFQAEMQRAQEHGAKMFLLVENATWESLINGRYKSRFSPVSFLASITAWMIRYDLHVIMCKAETSGRLIKEILYRDFKERLERGEFNAGMDKTASEN